MATGLAEQYWAERLRAAVEGSQPAQAADRHNSYYLYNAFMPGTLRFGAGAVSRNRL